MVNDSPTNLPAAHMPSPPLSKHRASEAGNVFFIVMLGVILLGALMFTMSKGSRQGSSNMTKRQATLTATDILGFAQNVTRGVNKIMGSYKYSEDAISFEDPQTTGYTNANCTEDGCKVFTLSGGATNFVAPNSRANDGSPWIFSGYNHVSGIGTDPAADLILILDNVNQTVCEQINEQLGITTMPTDTNGIDTTHLYDGSFDNTKQIGDGSLDKITTACVQNQQPNPDTYFFYSVLWAR